ncbi:MAG: hypothetical protein EBV41_04260, partial [Actinobacteria bacterium]|nr:hypothetical protein [Actinomycetota bacterium]
MGADEREVAMKVAVAEQPHRRSASQLANARNLRRVSPALDGLLVLAQMWREHCPDTDIEVLRLGGVRFRCEQASYSILKRRIERSV